MHNIHCYRHSFLLTVLLCVTCDRGRADDYKFLPLKSMQITVIVIKQEQSSVCFPFSQLHRKKKENLCNYDIYSRSPNCGRFPVCQRHVVNAVKCYFRKLLLRVGPQDIFIYFSLPCWLKFAFQRGDRNETAASCCHSQNNLQNS